MISRRVFDAILERDNPAVSNTSSVEWERPQTECGNTRRGLTHHQGLVDRRAEMHSTRRCSVDECDHSDIQARGLCRMHYFRWYRTGSLDVRHPQRPTRGTCVVEGCGKVDEGALGLCSMHATRMRRHGDPLVVKDAGHYYGAEHPRWVGQDATYGAMHARVRRERGRASAHRCVDCESRAQHWSYDHADPSERTSATGPYSVDVSHYEPRCVSCHKRFDLGAHDAS